MNPVISAVISKPDVYEALLVDMVQKLGFTAALALILVLFLCALITYLLRHVIKGYQASILVLNTQNKEYQDYFLDKRTSSGKKFLAEETDKPK